MTQEELTAQQEQLEMLEPITFTLTQQETEKPIRAIDLPMSEMQKGMLEEQKSKKTLNLFWQ